MNFREYLKESETTLTTESLKKERESLEGWLGQLGFAVGKLTKIKESNIALFGGSVSNTFKQGMITKDGKDVGYLTVKTDKVPGFGTNHSFYISTIADKNAAIDVGRLYQFKHFAQAIERLKL